MNIDVNGALELIRDALLETELPVYHYAAFKKSNKYIVWAEDNVPESVWSDDICNSLILEGTIDYFTKNDFDENVELIQDILSTYGIIWEYNSIQYEEETKYIHHEWVWRVMTE